MQSGILSQIEGSGFLEESKVSCEVGIWEIRVQELKAREGQAPSVLVYHIGI